jgi:hypothetical protein
LLSLFYKVAPYRPVTHQSVSANLQSDGESVVEADLCHHRHGGAIRPQFIRATLHGHDIAAACGFTARSSSPVLDLCRKFLAAGVPDQPLHAYRGDVLCLIVRSTGEGARLEVAEGIGFRQYRKASPASLAAPNAPARTRRRTGGGRRTGGADA